MPQRLHAATFAVVYVLVVLALGTAGLVLSGAAEDVLGPSKIPSFVFASALGLVVGLCCSVLVSRLLAPRAGVWVPALCAASLVGAVAIGLSWIAIRRPIETPDATLPTGAALAGDIFGYVGPWFVFMPLCAAAGFSIGVWFYHRQDVVKSA